MTQSGNRTGGGSRVSHSQTGNGTRGQRGTAGSRQTDSSRNKSSQMRSSYQPRRHTKRRKQPRYDITRILLGIIAVVVAVIVIAALVKVLGNKKDKEAAVTTESVSETELKKDVVVDGITITGMSREEARTALLKEIPWEMKVTYSDKQYEVSNLMETKIDEVLTEIYDGEAKESYSLDTSGMEEAVKTEVTAIAGQWDVPAKNGSISGFDKENSKFIYSGEQKGVVIDQDKLSAAILKAVTGKDFKAVIQAEAKEVAPEISEAQAKEMYQVIGTYSTTTTSNKDRNKNIELAAAALEGLIVQPGEEFSFNNTTGERSLAKGYKPAGAYVNGILVEEPGGGVCQVSSTLYNAVVFSGLTTTERHAHSYEPSYVTPGEDAMVSFGGPDMKFVNKSASAIAIRASFAGQKLKISIVGIPILESGVTLSMTSKKTAELDAPAPVYEEDQTLEPGVEKVLKAETKGSRWVTNMVTKKDGVVVSDEFFHNSTYRGKPATIKRNTSGVVVPATGGETSASETVAGASEGQTAPPAGTTAAGQQGPGATEATTAAAPSTSAGSIEGSQAGPGESNHETEANIVPPAPIG